MAQAKKLNSGNWRVRIAYNGKRLSFTAETKKAAELKASAFLLNASEEEQEEQGITLGAAVEEYIASRESILSPSTLHSYETYSRLYFGSLMGKVVTDITLSDIQAQINELSLDKSYKTVRNIVLFFIGVLDYYDVTIRTKKLRFPARQKVEYATPDTDRIKQILAATKGTDIEIAVLLSMWCSLRMGEVLGLKWSKITEQTITIDNTLQYIGARRVEKPPKTTESTRTLPTPRYIWERLQNVPKNGEYVVPLTSIQLRTKFHKVLAENKIADCRFHDLRHANASVMLMLGIPDKYAMARGGWSTPDVYKGVYVQTFEKEQDEVATKIDGYFSKLL